jgi:hypothetical protein
MTASTASHPRMVLSIERHSAKWQASAPFRSLPTLQARKLNWGLAYLARIRRIFSRRPDGSVGSRDQTLPRPDITLQ